MTPDLPTTAGGWPVILADPAWRFGSISSRIAPSYRGKDRERAHYATMSIDAIMALPVAEIAAPNAVLALWSPNALVLDRQALDVVVAWGFVPKQLIPWVKLDAAGKPRLGGGSYTRVVTEQLILCTRGRVQPLRRDIPGILHEPRGGHSEKPDGAYAMLEQLFGGPYIELFARRRWSPQWTCWGREAPRGA